ncbi:lysine N(6)-hydroxylase/L-ornithine N(5)-oxygenase family protein [Phytohabitans houttuyneae]|uniref:L-lysine N6-monooxygenase MbtG n=1 Tax=Phytohabitans houttuyneae TaxID=1076126 RepID=A0A6V8KI64_9ACTN|nr:lysine N(6)-hydroxylase/L-ornithine N(5)-oxygenase family protein [Phytohabitans houttuyneae]GFJ83110.1 lysine/ornithine N-monooxygenase [Phytohabitans houttuyneae]
MSQAVPVYDLVGVGFGPSNLALAIALTEHNAISPVKTTGVFLERQPRFGWHRGMLIEDATMQVSFLKDLVTLRNPTSEFSFLCYLHSKDRLIDFINHKNLFPLRVEFHDYLEWAAAKVDDLVCYGHEVVSVEPVEGGFLDVTARSRDGVSVYRARNLVFATGLRPHLPAGVVPSDRVWHNRDLLGRAAELQAGKRFVVVGAGQSAAEVVAFLHDRFPASEVCAVFARYGYSPADDSAFANRIFDPAAVDAFYDAPPHVKQSLVDYHANTNYSVVDIDLIDELYRRVYREKVLGAQRLRLFNVSRVVDAVETPSGVRTTVESLATGERTVLDADAIVYATGYRPADPGPLLASYPCDRDEAGRLRVGRDYRVVTDPALGPGIYLQGGTEHTHGITSSLLSNTAIRAAEILASIVGTGVPAAAAQYTTA